MSNSSKNLGKLTIPLLLLLAISFFALPVQAKYGGGTGEPNDPYLIIDANHMNAIGADQNDWDKHFKLMSDVNLAAFTGTQFNIIGNYSNRFTGTFDGNDHTISNFTYALPGGDCIGLFGCVDGADAEIKDVGLVDANVCIEDYYGYYRAGSLVGYLADGTVRGCYTIGSRISGSYWVGGLVGQNSGDLTNCYATGFCTGDWKVGGLVGNNDGTITNCNTTGDVTGGATAGSLVGKNEGTIAKCYASGLCTGGTGIGGLVGENGEECTMSECYSKSAVVGFNCIGGLVGENYGAIFNSYATGPVTKSAAECVLFDGVGGLVGLNTGIIYCCYSTGSVSPAVGLYCVGGLVGYSEINDPISSFWDTQTSDQTTSDGGTGKTTAEMQTKSTFTDAGWDFNDVWYIDEGNSYPVLQSLYVIPPKTYHVDGATGDNTNDGLTRDTAFETIQYAIDEANDCDTVLVWPGVYNEPATHGINFRGKAITVKSSADAAVLEVPGFVAVTFIYGEDENSVFSNFVVRGSTAGIFALFANPTINNVTVVGNNNGVIADNANPLITNSIFWNNINGDLFGSPDPITAQYSFIQDEVETNLVAYWKLDGDATDSAGSNHGTIYGAAPTTGQVGGALSFDGDDCIQVPTHNSLCLEDAFTLSAFIKIDDSWNLYGRIICKRHDVSGNGYAFLLYNEKRPRLLTEMNEMCASDVSISLDRWTHVAATYDWANRRTAIYIDGIEVGYSVVTKKLTCSSYPLTFGKQADIESNYFSGLIDEVAVYDRALSSEEIEGLYNTGVAGQEYGPLFADADNGDYHLLSERGRYRATTDEWILDEVTSPCVDGGDPNIEPTGERMPNGGRINMGAYGNTAYAGMSEWPIKGDVNNDGRFNFMDIAILLDGWLQELPWAQ
ncbi:MAG: LamG domain-containing protein [Planctomycetota bacterium]|jgi:hypothetical protein